MGPAHRCRLALERLAVDAVTVTDQVRDVRDSAPVRPENRATTALRGDKIPSAERTRERQVERCIEFSVVMRTISALMIFIRLGRPTRLFASNVYFEAISSRRQRMIVSGATIVATRFRACRPMSFPFAARRRR
jgi:hypothetical protein